MALYVKLGTTYYLPTEVGNLSADAECLFTRARAYCGAAESHGFVPHSALPGLIRNPTAARVKKICAELTNAHPEALWTEEPGGFRLVKWDEEQSELEALLARRNADAVRQRAKRARDRGVSPGQGHLPGIT